MGKSTRPDRALPDNMMASLMQNATMCLYLSKAEGSGMTVLRP